MCQAGNNNKDEAGMESSKKANTRPGWTTRVQRHRITRVTADLQLSIESAHHYDTNANFFHANCQCPCLPGRLNGITPQKAIPGVIDRSKSKLSLVHLQYNMNISWCLQRGHTAWQCPPTCGW